MVFTADDLLAKVIGFDIEQAGDAQALVKVAAASSTSMGETGDPSEATPGLWTLQHQPCQRLGRAAAAAARAEVSAIMAHRRYQETEKTHREWSKKLEADYTTRQLAMQEWAAACQKAARCANATSAVAGGQKVPLDTPALNIPAPKRETRQEREPSQRPEESRE